MLSIGLCTQIACMWEATARKPGNVHRYRDFDDTSYVDFLLSAAAIAPLLETATQRPVGKTILSAIQATRQVVNSNTNLGILLLLAPLAAVPRDQELGPGVVRILEGLDASDACAVYQAIRLAVPGGLGRVPEQDVSDEPTQTLRQVMALAAERDLVARQYANGFREVFDDGVGALSRGLKETGSIEGAIIFCHLHMMASHPDSLVARKRGLAEAEEASQRAGHVLRMKWPSGPASWDAFAEFDAWLLADGHNRNPGTTADLVAACLFVLLRADLVPALPSISWTVNAPTPA